MIINQDGSANVGVWGRDFNMSPDIKAVRQNLVLIVDNGQLNPELREDDTTAFGATLGNNVYVWRSGVGVTADGALVYAGGPAMSVSPWPARCSRRARCGRWRWTSTPTG